MLINPDTVEELIAEENRHGVTKSYNKVVWNYRDVYRGVGLPLMISQRFFIFYAIIKLMVGIFIQYLQWHYYQMSQNILQGWRNFLEFGLNYFSTPVLAKTLFSPWRRYRYEYPRRFDPGQWFNALTFNLMSRGIGAVVRLFMIGIGIVAETLILLAGIFIFLLWLALPFLIVVLLFLGIKLII